MKQRNLFGRIFAIAFASVSLSLPSFAAIKYEFRQVTRSDARGASETVRGKAVIEGLMSRIDFLEGSPYGDGAYMIGGTSRKLLIVQPQNKTYTEIEPRDVSNVFVSDRLTVSNAKATVKQLDDHPQIAGHVTNHYQIELTYDITAKLGEMSIPMNVHAVIDKWTTESFGDVMEQYASSEELKTGNPQIDELIVAETQKVKGFPLRELKTITTTNRMQGRNDSQLRVAKTRKHTSEMTITRIDRSDVDPQTFMVPASFTRSESKNDSTAVHMLDMQQDTKQ